MIYTVTLNPCLDYVMECDTVKYGETNRSKSESITFGGKGINVSFVLKELGIDSVALGFVGGFTGDELVKCVSEKKIVCDFVKVANGNTRINLKIKGEEITEINASGLSLSDDDLKKMYQRLDKVSDGDTVVMGGSAPKGAPESIYEQICQRLCHKDVKLVVDTTGEKLLSCLKYKPFLIKPNISELEEIFGVCIDSEQEIIKYMTCLQKDGAQNVVVSMGKNGAVLLDSAHNVIKISAHKIKAVNTVGAGDSMVAGFLAGAEKSSKYALKLGNACGAATAMSKSLAVKSDIDALMKCDELL